MDYKNKVFKCSRVKFEIADCCMEAQNCILGKSIKSIGTLVKKWKFSKILPEFLESRKEEIWYKAEWKTPWMTATQWIGGNYVAFIMSL